VTAMRLLGRAARATAQRYGSVGNEIGEFARKCYILVMPVGNLVGKAFFCARIACNEKERREKCVYPMIDSYLIATEYPNCSSFSVVISRKLFGSFVVAGMLSVQCVCCLQCLYNHRSI